MKNCWPLLKISLAIILLVTPGLAWAEDGYPKLANYYLSFFDARQYQDLARWDLLVVQPEMVHYQSSFWTYYKKQQPQGKILAYTYPAMFYRQFLFYDYWSWRTNIFKTIEENNWWLTDTQGKIAEPWPQTSAINITKEDYRRFNLDYLDKIFKISTKWDGIFFDMVDIYASYYQPKGIDIDQDGRNDSPLKIDTAWRVGMAKFLAESRDKWPNKIIVVNGNDYLAYQSPINGRMFETWPTPWQGRGTWADSMKSYLVKLPAQNKNPQIYILNGAYNPVDRRDVYAQMRFGLASTLLGDGYWSFDGGEKSHSELWWFDEYSLDLGEPTNTAYNLLDPTSVEIKAGLWRRDFTRGVTLVNATTRAQTINLGANKFHSFAGLQDPAINRGEAVDSLTLCPKTGIILLKQGAPDPDLSGNYLSCYDYQSARGNQLDWRGRIKNSLEMLIRKIRFYE
jgi:hypothetical protein